MKRGANQSADTKFATYLVCDAVALINSGRVAAGLQSIQRALSMLPDIDREEQKDAVSMMRKLRRGFAA